MIFAVMAVATDQFEMPALPAMSVVDVVHLLLHPDAFRERYRALSELLESLHAAHGPAKRSRVRDVHAAIPDQTGAGAFVQVIAARNHCPGAATHR